MVTVTSVVEIADRVAVKVAVPDASAILELSTERVTVGSPSITSALLLPKEPEAPGVGRVSVASFPALSLILVPAERADVFI